MTFVLCGLLSSGNCLLRKDPTKKGNALQALFPLLSRPLPARKLLQEIRALGLLLRGAPGVVLGGGLPLLPLDLGPARGVGAPLGIRLGRAGSLPLLLLLQEEEEWELPARCRRPFPASPMLSTLPNSHRTFHDVRIRGSRQHLAPAFCPPAVHALRSVDRGRIRGLGHVRVTRVGVAVALAPLPVRGQEVESVGSGHRPRRSLLVPAHAVSGRGLLTATVHGVEALGRVVTGLDPRTDTSHAVSVRGLLTATACVVSERVPLPAGGSGVTARGRPLSRVARLTARGRSGGRLPGSPARLRAEESGRLARRETQEGVEAVASLPPVVSEAAAGVTPVAGGVSITALPSVMQELAKFFLGLSSSSSLGASGDIAGVTASAAASGGIACPASTAGGTATICAAAVTPAGAGVLPAAPAAVPSVSGEQQRKVESRSRGRRSRSSSDGTDRRAKKRSRRRSPSPERSSRRRGRRYRSSSDSSEEDRADVSPPRSRRAHGGARTGGSFLDFDRSPRPGTSRSSVREERYQSGVSRRSPVPSGVVDNDRSTTFESVDFARDDSFRAVLGLIRELHDMAEPAGVPAARCKTSLAPAYGLMSETSRAFTLPVSPLLSTLLLDINSDLCKFLEDQTVHGFLPVPGRRHQRYYGTSTSSFPGPYTIPPGVTSITLEKASEVKKRSVSLSASQVSSMETMLSGMCEVSSWLDWWLSTCGGFRDHLPIEVRADFERLMISGSRALEFLASQGCTTLGNLVLARRDALLADVRGTVPAEEVARLRYSPLPQSASIFPHALLDSALLKMRAAASDALVQRTLHPPRIPRKPAASGHSDGSSTARSGQAGTSGASQTQKQSASSSPSGQSGQRKKKGKGKAPFSSSSRGSGRSGGKGKGTGKKSA